MKNSNLYYAIMAFWTILTGREHIYSDHKRTSLYGNRKEIASMQDSVRNMWNDEVNCLKQLEEAKKLLNQE